MQERHLSAVIEACQRIQQAGGTPTTALIRSKLGSPVPLPDIIKGLKSWQNNPKQTTELASTPEAQEPLSEVINVQYIHTLLRRIETLENAVTDLQTEVKDLKRQ